MPSSFFETVKNRLSPSSSPRGCRKHEALKGPISCKTVTEWEWSTPTGSTSTYGRGRTLGTGGGFSDRDRDQQLLIYPGEPLKTLEDLKATPHVEGGLAVPRPWTKPCSRRLTAPARFGKKIEDITDSVDSEPEDLSVRKPSKDDNFGWKVSCENPWMQSPYNRSAGGGGSFYGMQTPSASFADLSMQGGMQDLSLGRPNSAASMALARGERSINVRQVRNCLLPQNSARMMGGDEMDPGSPGRGLAVGVPIGIARPAAKRRYTEGPSRHEYSAPIYKSGVGGVGVLTPGPGGDLGLPFIEHPISPYSAPSVSSAANKVSRGNPNSTNRKDLIQYPPVQRFSVSQVGSRIYTVPNGITDETLLAMAGPNFASIFRIKTVQNTAADKNKDGDNEQDSKMTENEISKKNEFAMEQIHTIVFNQQQLSCFAISEVCSVTLPPRRLMYAAAPSLSKTVHYVNFSDADFLPEKLSFDGNRVPQDKYTITTFNNPHQTLAMAIKDDKALACLLENRMVVVWDIPKAKKLCTFQLSSQGTHLSWHQSEDLRLMVVESGGQVKFFNISKYQCYMMTYMSHKPLYSGDWANTSSLYGMVGWPGGFTMFNTSQPNSNAHIHFEMPCKAFKRVLFNPNDHKTVATLELGATSSAIIRFWRTHLSHFIWAHSSDQIKDIAWMCGKPYLIALGHRDIFIFDATPNA